jgi:hypothetical protein
VYLQPKLNISSCFELLFNTLQTIQVKAAYVKERDIVAASGLMAQAGRVYVQVAMFELRALFQAA